MKEARLPGAVCLMLVLREAGMALRVKIQTFALLSRGVVVLAALALAGMSGGAGAQMGSAPSKLHYSPNKRFTLPVHPAGLWDPPNQACITKCKIHKKNGCFTRLSEKSPTATAAEINEKCDAKFSLCLYDCMCDTCDENQIIIKQPQ